MLMRSEPASTTTELGQEANNVAAIGPEGPGILEGLRRFRFEGLAGTAELRQCEPCTSARLNLDSSVVKAGPLGKIGLMCGCQRRNGLPVRACAQPRTFLGANNTSAHGSAYAKRQENFS